jgi:hypothetical protein
MKTTIASMFLSLSLFFSAVALGADAPKGKPVATCNDGKTMYSETGDHRAACSGHGGVKAWADGSPVKSKGRKTSYR